MKPGSACAILDNPDATIEQLREAEDCFRKAGLKGLLNRAQERIGVLNRPMRQSSVPIDRAVFRDAISKINDPAELQLLEMLLRQKATMQVFAGDLDGLHDTAGQLILTKVKRIVGEL